MLVLWSLLCLSLSPPGLRLSHSLTDCHVRLSTKSLHPGGNHRAVSDIIDIILSVMEAHHRLGGHQALHISDKITEFIGFV